MHSYKSQLSKHFEEEYGRITQVKLLALLHTDRKVLVVRTMKAKHRQGTSVKCLGGRVA